MAVTGLVVSATKATGSSTDPFNAVVRSDYPIYSFQVIAVGAGSPTVNVQATLEDPVSAGAAFVTIGSMSALAPGSISTYTGHLSQIKYTMGGTGSAYVICRMPNP